MHSTSIDMRPTHFDRNENNKWTAPANNNGRKTIINFDEDTQKKKPKLVK